MKILLLSEIFPPLVGGSGNWFFELYKRLEKKVVVICQQTSGLKGLSEEGNLRVYRDKLTPQSLHQMGPFSIRGLYYYLRVFFLVKKIYKRESAEIIHCGKVLPEGLVALMLKKVFGIKYFLFVHGEEIEGALLSREYTLLVKWVLAGASLIICNSQNTKQLLAKWGQEHSDNAKVLYPGVDIKHFSPQQYEQDIYPGKKIIMTLSRLQKRKGHDYLIKSLHQVIAKIPNVHYLIVGRGEEEQPLQDLIDKEGLNEYVEVLTGLDNNDIVRYYNRADLFVLPNRKVGNDIEGLGIVLLEAQSCGTPVIAGNSGGTYETLLDGVTGLIIDSSRPSFIADSILKLLLDGTQLKTMSHSAREHIVESFTWDVQIIKAKEIFNSKSY